MTMSHEELKARGNQCFTDGEYKQAIECYTQALVIHPRSHLALSNRSAAFIKLGKYEEGLVDALSCVSISPEFARAYLRKATALNGLGRFDEAMEAAEEGYRLRGSDKICRDCVTQWLLASAAALKADMDKLDDIPPGVSPVSSVSVKILSTIQHEHSSPRGISPDFMSNCISQVIVELKELLKRFGHSLHPCANAWVTALVQALKPDPSSHSVQASVAESLKAKSRDFALWLKSDIDPALYPAVSPIVALATLAIVSCCLALSRVISFRNTIQILVRACLPFYENSVLSGEDYRRLHIHALQILLNSFCMESGQAQGRGEQEKAEILETSKMLEGLLQLYPSTTADWAEVRKSSQEVLENVTLLLVPRKSGPPQESKHLTKKDLEMVKRNFFSEQETLKKMTRAGERLNFRDMDSLVLATGGLVHLGEVKNATDALAQSESLYFQVISDLLEANLLPLDSAAEALFHPQTMMLTNALFFEGIDDTLLANTVVKWKCLSSEFYALLARMGVGSSLMNTFRKIEQLKVSGQGKVSQGDVLAELADEHKREVTKVLQKWGPKAILALSYQSCEQIQGMLKPDQVLLEFCVAALYDTKCHPVPIPPNFLKMCGVIVVLTPMGGAPLVRVVDFGKIQELALKVHKTAMTAVAAKRSGKPWEHLQAVSDEAGAALLHAILPEDVQSIITTSQVKRIVFCPDQLLAKLPLEILPFNGGERLGEKYAVTYLSSARELLRESTLSSLQCEPVETDHLNKCILFANPNYDLERQEKVSDGFVLWSQLTSSLSSFFSKLTEGNVHKILPLPSSENEANGIKVILSSTSQNTALQVQSFVGDKATLHGALELQSPRLLHFATHGFSNPDFHYQYRNFWSDTKHGLLLAGANTYRFGKFGAIVNEAGTGELTALVACGMRLAGTRLVYLSTCRSSYGFIGRGESLSSLAQGFRTAGAQTVIATLWPCSDEVAQKLALHFYSSACRAGLPPSVALLEAKKKLREEGYSHWYDWAGFLCFGIDAPLL